MTISLSPEAEAILTQEVERRGLNVNEFVSNLVIRNTPKIDWATIDLLDKWEKEDWTDDPEELARREKELEEFKQAMNRNRLESDGPDARTPFPQR